jgi:hypothetical protein
LGAALTNRLLFLILFLLGHRAFAEGPFEKLICPEARVLANELLESEVSGQRFYAAKDECRDEKKSIHFRPTFFDSADNQSDAKFLIAADRNSFEITKFTELEGGIHQVEFSWHILDEKNPKKTKTIRDLLKFAAYKGKIKDVVGCAGVLFAPEHLVIRQSCINFEKLKK